MALQVIGAGYPRTGTTSLRAALGQLLGGPCYHMKELFQRREHVPIWRDAYAGQLPDWDTLLAGYAAGVDWPISHFWRELADHFPDALVLLSRRESPQQWYASMDRTVLGGPRAIKQGTSWLTRRRED
ncbi:MAG TPA: sulfotransferase, partial [Microlunatus sp.]